MDDRCQLLLHTLDPIADLNTRFAKAFKDLGLLTTVTFTLYAEIAYVKTALESKNSTHAENRVLTVSANVACGSRELISVGTILSDHGIYLQDPDWKENTYDYSNPHIMKFEGISDIDVWLHEMTLGQRPEISEPADWGLVLNHLPQYHTLASDVDASQLQVTLLTFVFAGDCLVKH